ncbi:MAG: plasmid recombination protein [Clostridia bacterium]|nr:plasmid recombination protein [Clostridia bacterium]
MSYAIIRNKKYKRNNLKGIFRHNERRNKNYSNKNIKPELSYLNYSLKDCTYIYEKEFDLMREKYNLKGQVKSVSNIVCEYMITSDQKYFESIGAEETRRYFETAYKFVCEYQNLGEEHIISAKVHMDEDSPHLHLVFVPVVHTKDSKGNNIDKIACSEFWKGKDSYRQLQNAFHSYVTKHGFNLERGLPVEETSRKHYSVKKFKELTNYEKTKELLESMKLELPETPELKDIKKIMINRDEKIENEIIKPKDKIIQKLYKENVDLHKELSRQSKIADEAEKYEKERDSIIADNKSLNTKVEQLEREYKVKSNNLDFDYNNRKYELENEFKEKEFEIEYKYQSTIHKLEKENKHLNKIVDKFYETVEKFINWICKKFSLGESKELIKDFEIETNICIDPKEQIQKEDREKEWYLEL